MQRVTGYGLRLDTQLAVPGAIGTVRSGPPDISIVLEPLQAIADAPVYAREQDGLCFTCPDVARYRISLTTIRVAPDPAAQSEIVSDMLVATALPALLWLRERFVLHAGAVQLPAGGTVAIAGVSGSGKSTVLAQLVAAGAALIGDDTIAFSRDTGTLAQGLAGGWFAAGEAAADRRFVPVPSGRSCVGADISAILLLDPQTDGDGNAVRLDPVAAVTGLLTHRHRPRVPALLGRLAETLRHATVLAGEIPLYSWRRRAGVAPLTPGELTMLEQIAMGKEIE